MEHVQTHISDVFLAGPWVYKLKKPVRFSFLDASTVERRRVLCEEEVRLNRRLAAPVYLGVVPITRAAGGGLRLGGEGEVVDHVVWMRLLPADRLLPQLLAAGAATPAMLAEVAHRLAAFHATTPADAALAALAEPAALAQLVGGNLAECAPSVGTLLAPEDHAILADFAASFVVRHESLLRARARGGHVRDGHGDLHAEHVCVLDAPVPGGPGEEPLPPGVYVFDCIDFAPELRAGDVAGEVAFLAMDLEARGYPALAARFAAAYAEAAGDPEVATLLPFYGCHRAAVRGKVEGLQARAADMPDAARDEARARALRHFALALRFAWRAGGPAVIAVAGLSGTGKSALAEALADATGFPLLATDALRGRVAAAAYGDGAYTPAARAAVYDRLVEEAERRLADGVGAVADATFLRAADRRRLATAAHRERRPIVFVECRAPADVVRARLDARTPESRSDARWETYVLQQSAWEPFLADEPHVVVDTGGTLAAARAAALTALWPWRQGRPLRAGPATAGTSAEEVSSRG